MVFCLGFRGGSEVKNLPAMQRPGLDLGSGRSPGEGNGNLLQYSCLETPMDRGAWWATVHGVTKSPTGLRKSPTGLIAFHFLGGEAWIRNVEGAIGLSLDL